MSALTWVLIAAGVVVLFGVPIMAIMKGSAKREIEFRKAFKQRCMEEDREHQDQR